MYRFTLRGAVKMIKQVYNILPAGTDHPASSSYFATTTPAPNIDQNYEVMTIFWLIIIMKWNLMSIFFPFFGLFSSFSLVRKRAIAKLNTLQSNYSALQDSIKLKHQNESKHVNDTEKFLKRIHISSETLNRLAIIHVAGTKGKVGITRGVVELLADLLT